MNRFDKRHFFSITSFDVVSLGFAISKSPSIHQFSLISETEFIGKTLLVEQKKRMLVEAVLKKTLI